MDLVEELTGLVDALNALGVGYAVCGGIALAIHGYPRFTQDIDLLVQRSELERIRIAARKRGFTLEGMPMCFGAGSGTEREIVRLTKVEGPDTLTLDLLLTGPAFKDVWLSRVRTEWRNRELWVVSKEGLVQMKRLAGRAQDLADIEALSRPLAGGTP
jgi:hypothetical protein